MAAEKTSREREENRRGKPMRRTDWRLDIDGDNREKKWAKRTRRDFPAYEELWRKHVVPLTYRVMGDGTMKYLRPTQPQHYLDLADANYATLYHLTSCYEWKTRLASYPTDKAILPTESFYCFFAHAISCVDSVLWFADAVNRVLQANRESKRFDLVEAKDREGRPRGYFAFLRQCIGGPDVRAFSDLTRELKDYRNLVIHRRPLFMLSKNIPVKSQIERYSGLAAISRLAMNLDHLRVYFGDAEEVLDGYATTLGYVLNPLWEFATRLLDGLPLEHLQARAIPDPADVALTSLEIKRAITLGRKTRERRSHEKESRPEA